MERKKGEMSISLGGNSCLWPICISPLYRSCISDAWMHKWLTCLHICLACSAPLPPLLSLTRPRGGLSACLLSIFLSAFAPRFPLRSPMLQYFFLLFRVINISPSPPCYPFLVELKELASLSSFINLLPLSFALYIPHSPAPFLSSFPSYYSAFHSFSHLSFTLSTSPHPILLNHPFPS